MVNSRDGNRTSEIMQPKGNDLINTIYQSINITKTRIETKPGSSEEQTSEPYFTISIDYLDGTQDNIYSTEGGSFVYKRLSESGWIGGNNNDLIEIVKKL